MPSNNNISKSAIDSPSIAQQRIVIVVFLVITGTLVWWQNIGRSVNYPAQKFSTTPLPDVVAELDFTSAEASWSSLHFDPQGNLKIDAQTEPALVDAVALAYNQHPKQSKAEPPIELPIARTALLLEKQFGTTASQQIMALLPILKNYKDIEQHWWEENGSRVPPPYAELFQLQDEVLGETLAEKLFSEQRSLANMMLASYQIRNDTNLTQAEKDQALADLQASFQHSFQAGASDEPDFQE